MTFVNVILCMAGLWMCVCRAKHMSLETTRRSVRFWYALLFTLLLSSLVMHPAQWWQVAGTALIVVYLLAGIRDWWHGLPKGARNGT